MLVSVITPTYVNFSNIEKVIKSVLSQTYNEIEYIICDDGSNGFNEKTIRKYVSKYKNNNLKNFILIHHDENKGTVKNLNHAYRSTNGELIIQVASDDELFDEYVIEKIANRYIETHFKILLTSRMICNENDDPMCLLPHINERDIISRLTHKEQCDRFIGKRIFDITSGSCLSLDREFIMKFGCYDEKYVLYEDAPFFWRYLQSYPLECDFSIISIKYHLGGVSTSKKVNPVLQKDMDLFNTTDRVSELDKVSIINRRRALFDKYSVNYRLRNDWLGTTMNRIRFFDTILISRIESIIRKRSAKRDKKYIMEQISSIVDK